MKVLLINNQHYHKGGAHSVYFNTHKLLQENGHEAYFFSMRTIEMLPYEYSNYFPELRNYRQSSPLEKIVSARKFLYNSQASKKLEQFLKVSKPDVAHVHLFMGGLTTSILNTLNRNKIPVVHTVHDYRLVCPAYLFINGKQEICEKCKSKRYLNCLMNRCSNNSILQSAILTFDAYNRHYLTDPMKLINSYIFVSRFALLKHVEFGLPTNISKHVLFNFLPNLFEIKPNTKKGKYFLYFGRLSREKGLLTLIEAARIAGIYLKIAGTGQLPIERRLINNDRIEYLGFKTGNELNNLILQSSFVIVPSEWYENNPMSIIESLAHGKPVIGANIGGIPEIIRHKITGFLFESKNVDSLVEQIVVANDLDEIEYIKMSNNARNFAEQEFNPQNHLRKLLEIYNESIKSA